jgi:hypothetical protein
MSPNSTRPSPRTTPAGERCFSPDRPRGMLPRKKVCKVQKLLKADGPTGGGSVLIGACFLLSIWTMYRSGFQTGSDPLERE